MNTHEKIMALIEPQAAGNLYIELVQAVGAQGAIFLSTLFDFSEGDEWVLKSKAEWEKVTGFDVKTLRYAATRMCTKGLIQINPEDESYRINGDAFVKLLKI